MVKLVLAITGASGSIYAKLLMDFFVTQKDVELAVVMSKNAKDVWRYELGNDDYSRYPFTFYESHDFMAPFASGSSSFEGMIVCPCSMGTLGRIANGISDSLLTRAADVMLKEQRKLILVARETPYNLLHIKNMETLVLSGAVICPATPSYYALPKTVEDVALTVVHRVLRLCGFNPKDYRWNEKV